jgi:PAT family beta-lactamase induction signal transducer AmpG
VSFLAVFRSRRMTVVFLLGVAAGLPLLLTGQILQVWMTKAGVDLGQIAAFSLVGLAYTFKFAWAPLLDRYRLPFLGRRRGWLLVTQLMTATSIVVMGLVDPVTQTGLLAILAVCVAACSASHDIVFDAYKVDLLSPEERAAGAATYIVGYRVGTLIAGTGALFLNELLPWSVIYPICGSLMLIGVVGTLIAEEPPLPTKPPATIVQAVYLPFSELFARLGTRTALVVLVFVAIYKFGEYFAQSLLMPFFIRGLGFESAEVATFYKILGFAAIFVGGLFAGTMVARFGMGRILFAFGILQAITNLLYVWLAVAGHDYLLFGGAVFVDHVTGAMGTAAFVAYLMSVCSTNVSATQYALLTSLSSVGQRVFGPLADDVVSTYNPQGFERLVATHAIIAEHVQPHIDQAVVGFHWSALPDLVMLEHDVRLVLVPHGHHVVNTQDWPWFFIVTALMAIPGIAMALVVGRKLPAGEPARSVGE